MSVLLLSLLAFAKRLGSGALSWLTHASFWQLVSLGLLCLSVVQHFTLIDARHDAAAYLKQRDGYKAQLDALSSKKNEQQVVTKTNIVTVTKTIYDADERAKKVETAPIAPTSCHGVTPSIVLGADL